MKQSLFEQMGGKYERQGDYLFPCLTVPAEEEQPIGIWGCGCPDTSAEGRSTDRAGRRDQRHRRFLKEHHRIMYYSLLTDGKLNSYLADVDRQAEKMLSRLVTQMEEQEGVTEKLKAQNQMEWIGRMNNIRNRATEIVNSNFNFA